MVIRVAKLTVYFHIAFEIVSAAYGMNAPVVDDNPMIKSVLKPAFARAGWQADYAKSVAQAKQLLEMTSYQMAVGFLLG